MNEPELIPQPIADGLLEPAGVAFDSDGNLWCAETGALVRIDAATGAISRVDVGGSPRGLALDVYGRVWFADRAENAIRRHDPETGKTALIADAVYDQPLESPDQLLFDARGQLLFTCLGRDPESKTGYVCCIQPDRVIDQCANELTSPSGLCLIYAGESLLITEPMPGRIWRGDWNDEDCFWTGESVWVDSLSGGPGAMAMGVDGHLYVAQQNGPLLAINASGLIVERIPLPFPRVGGLAFDPMGQLGLILTDPVGGRVMKIPGIGPGIALYDSGAAWPL